MSKSIRIALTLAFLIPPVTAFAAGCPEITSARVEVKRQGTAIVLTAEVEPKVFRLFFQLKVYALSGGREREIPGLFHGFLEPSAQKRGENSITLFDETDGAWPDPGTVHKVVFDIDGHEGCVTWRTIYFVLFRSKDGDVLRCSDNLEDLKALR